MSDKYTKLGRVLDRENYTWLVNNSEDIAAAIEAEVLAGADPEAIGRFMLAHIGEDRRALVARCVSAARWLHSSRG